MKCSIITIHHIHNFGSIFQAYALYRFLSNNGYDVEIINYQPSYYKLGRNRIKTIIANIADIKRSIAICRSVLQNTSNNLADIWLSVRVALIVPKKYK